MSQNEHGLEAPYHPPNSGKQDMEVDDLASELEMEGITKRLFHVCVGDISPEVDERMLKQAFGHFGDISEVKVVRDPKTRESKEYGFVSFAKREDYERATEEMDGALLGRSAITTNWRLRKPTDTKKSGNGTQRDMSYDVVFNQTTSDNTKVCIDNIAKRTTIDDINKAFVVFGQIDKIICVKGHASVTFVRKESAARAIIAMTSQTLCGQTIKCNWGVSREDGDESDNDSQQEELQKVHERPQQQQPWNNNNNNVPTAAYMEQFQEYSQQNQSLLQQWKEYYLKLQEIEQQRMKPQ